MRRPLVAERYIADEQRLGRMLDYAVIVPRLQRLYEWSASEPVYAWPYEQRHVWRPPHTPLAARVLERATRAS